jgi:hypothetical protein
MINAEKYIQIVELIRSKDDIETVEAFLYNRGKIVIDKQDLYRHYNNEERRQILEAHENPKKTKCILRLGGYDEICKSIPGDEEDEDENYMSYR